MAFGGQMHDGIGLMLAEDPLHRGAVGNIGLLENVAVVARDRFERLETARIGQLVHIDDGIAGLCQDQLDQRRADKARAAGDYDFHANISLMVHHARLGE